RGVYYLPLRAAVPGGQPGVTALEVSSGRVLARIPWERGVPGNLVFAEGKVLSQSINRLTAHRQQPEDRGVPPGTRPSFTREGARADASQGHGPDEQQGELGMAKPLVTDELWQAIEPLLPPPKPRRTRNPGRRPLEPRKVLTGILFVLKTGIPWEDLP